jgi:hypothetical protein
MTDNKPAKKAAAKKAPAKKAQSKNAAAEQVPASAPVRLEIRLNGRIRYADQVYDPSFDVTDDSVTVSAGLKPTMVDAPELPPPTVFAEQADVRDGEDFIPRVHSGRRDLPQQDPVAPDWPAGSPQAEQVTEQVTDEKSDETDE